MARTPVATIQEANDALIVQGDVDAIATYFAPDYVVHLTDGMTRRGHAPIRGFVNLVRSAFPDVQVEVEVLIEGKDRIAWQRTMRATHRGEFQGFPPTGRRIVWRDMLTSRFEGARIAEEWAVSDLAEQPLRARKA